MLKYVKVIFESTLSIAILREAFLVSKIICFGKYLLLVYCFAIKNFNLLYASEHITTFQYNY